MILYTFFFDVQSEEYLTMKCDITEELENNHPAKSKNYVEKKISIFIED